MPRKGSRAARQGGRNRRPSVTTQPNRPQVVPTSTGPLGQTVPDAGVATAPVTASVVEPRPAVTRRPLPVAPAANSLASEQVRNEVSYIRKDLIRLLITTAAVIAFMIGALLLLS